MQHGKRDTRPEFRNLVPASLSYRLELNRRRQPSTIARIEMTNVICAKIFMVLLLQETTANSTPGEEQRQ